MRSLISILALSTLVIGCAKSGGGSSDSMGTDIYNPTLKPANAASQQYALDFFKKMKTSDKYLPHVKGVFTTLVQNGQVIQNSEDSEEKKKAVAKLNSEGRELLKQIKENCQIKNPTFMYDNQQPGPGGITKSTESSSIDGDKCPVTITEVKSITTNYTNWQRNENTNQENISGTETFTNISARSVKEEKYVNLSGLRSMKSSYSASRSFSFQQDGRSGSSKNSTITKANFEITLASNEIIKGELSGETNEDDRNTSFRAVVSLETSGGTIRMVRLINSGSEPLLYLNGEKINPSLVSGGLGLGDN